MTACFLITVITAFFTILDVKFQSTIVAYINVIVEESFNLFIGVSDKTLVPNFFLNVEI